MHERNQVIVVWEKGMGQRNPDKEWKWDVKICGIGLDTLVIMSGLLDCLAYSMSSCTV